MTKKNLIDWCLETPPSIDEVETWLNLPKDGTARRYISEMKLHYVWDEELVEVIEPVTKLKIKNYRLKEEEEKN